MNCSPVNMLFITFCTSAAHSILLLMLRVCHPVSQPPSLRSNLNFSDCPSNSLRNAHLQSWLFSLWVLWVPRSCSLQLFNRNSIKDHIQSYVTALWTIVHSFWLNSFIFCVIGRSLILYANCLAFMTSFYWVLLIFWGFFMI